MKFMYSKLYDMEVYIFTYLSHVVVVFVCSSDTYDVPAKKVKKNESEEDLLEMMENQENPLRCPVRLYEFYLSKWSVSLTPQGFMPYHPLSPSISCITTPSLKFANPFNA